MTIITLTENRKELVNAVTSVTGQKMRYQGPPTFAYTDGTFTVTKDGTLEVEEVMQNVDVLKKLAAQKLIDDSWDEEREAISIDLPMEKFDATSHLHLMQIIWGKQSLINKAVGAKAGFMVSNDFIMKLTEEPPTSLDRFLFLWNEAGGIEATRGIGLSEERISFSGFPYSEDPEWVNAYTDLVSAIGKEARITKRVKLEQSEPENEKYYFRVWLVRLGFGGDEYKTSRKKLLMNLSGNSAFRTEDQREVHLNKYRRKTDEA